MKARINKKGTLVIKGENDAEREELKAWEDRFAEGEAGFRIGKADDIKRAAEDVKIGRTSPSVIHSGER